MQKQPSLFSDTLPNYVNAENIQIRWGVARCEEDNSIFTVMVLSKDIPVALKCLTCDALRLYNPKESDAIQRQEARHL